MTFQTIKQSAVDAQTILSTSRMLSGNNSVAIHKLASAQRYIYGMLKLDAAKFSEVR